MNQMKPEWQWDELAGIGGMHNDEAVAAKYDEFHTSFRNVDEDNEHSFNLLGAKEDQTVLDMGAGTGLFAIPAAKRYSKVYAVDIASPMLTKAKEKAAKAGVTNIEFLQGGFLTYEHQGPPVDAVMSQAVLHHLPDFWKYVALVRIAAMLKPGGKFCLKDTVFSGVTNNVADYFEEMTKEVPDNVKPQQIRHIRQEYTTVEWIMEGLLRRAGFSIDVAQYNNTFFATYLCTKGGNS